MDTRCPHQLRRRLYAADTCFATRPCVLRHFDVSFRVHGERFVERFARHARNVDMVRTNILFTAKPTWQR
jgi:hypothetical protein